MCVCVISTLSPSKKPLNVSDLSKLDALLHKTHIKVFSGTKVPRPGMCKSVLSLSKIAHQMWCDHPFSQRNMTTEKTVGAGAGGDREVGVGGMWKKFEKGVWG